MSHALGAGRFARVGPPLLIFPDAKMADPVLATHRRGMTKRRREEVRLKSGDRCSRCGDQLRAGWEADHVIPLWMGGADALENLTALCPPCHRTHKTPADAKARAKVKRLLKKGAGLKVTRHPLKSRGFDRRLSRRFDGSIIQRDK